MNYFSDLKIFYGNCKYQSNSWTQTQSNYLITELKNELNAINDLEFKGINVSTMRGGTQNFQIVIVSTFNKLSNEVDLIESLNLNEKARNAAAKISGFFFDEVRIEHTRHRCVYENFNHPDLLKEF